MRSSAVSAIACAPMTTASSPFCEQEAALNASLCPGMRSSEMLMLGWMDAEALRRTLTEGRVTFWSRSRQEYWRKGDTSGHAQYVQGARLDCDGDAVLVTVEQIGAACHTGDHTCFDADDLDPATGHAPDADGSEATP